MARIVSITQVSSIKAGPGSTILPDGTILNPVPYDAADVQFDDGVMVQVERPLSNPKLLAAYAAAKGQASGLDGLKPGDVI